MHHKSPQEILETARGWREKPFQSLAWKLWRENEILPPDPVAVNNEVREAALRGTASKPAMTSAEVNLYYPEDSQELQSRVKVYQSWVDKVPQYSAKHLWKYLETSTRYSQWQETRKLPESLTFQEYWFLAEYLRKTEREGSRIPKPNPDRYAHLAPLSPPQKKLKSKVGNTYGNWLLTALHSEDENERPVFYNAMCQTCGNTIERFNYSRVGQPCGNCKRLEKTFAISNVERPGDITTAPNRTTFSPINLWETSQGWVAQKEKPLGAKRKMVLAEMGKPLTVELLYGEEANHRIKEQEDPPVKELSNFEKGVRALDLPNLE